MALKDVALNDVTAPRIALLHAHAWPEVRRGGERLIDDLAWYLRATGRAVDVIVGTDGPSKRTDHEFGSTIKLHVPRMQRAAAHGLTTLETFAIRAFVPLLRERYDVVHALTPTAVLAARLARRPTVYSVLGHPDPSALPNSRVQRATLRAAVARATVVTALSASAAAAVETTFGRAAAVLPPGVRMDRFVPRLEPRTGDPRILYSGAVTVPDKGVVHLLRAFERVLVHHPGARLQLSGPGDAASLFAALETDTAGRIGPHVDQLGPGDPEDVPERYRAATVSVLPSRAEAFGLVLVEALACGTPVVGGAATGAEDIVDDEAIGRLVRFGDVDQIADGILASIDLAAKPGTTERCRTSAQRWDWSTIGPKYTALYDEMSSR